MMPATGSVAGLPPKGTRTVRTGWTSATPSTPSNSVLIVMGKRKSRDTRVSDVETKMSGVSLAAAHSRNAGKTGPGRAPLPDNQG